MDWLKQLFRPPESHSKHVKELTLYKRIAILENRLEKLSERISELEEKSKLPF